MLMHQIKIAQSVLTSLTQGGRGMMGTAFPRQPDKPLKLYEFEGSPFCRRVREVMTALNLDYEVYPCPKGAKKYREQVKKIGGKLQFPFLIDENTGDHLYESQDIIHYLFKHYGLDSVTSKFYSYYPKYPVLALTGTLLSSARGCFVDKNIIDRPAPKQLLELWGFEASPYTRVVRNRLAELELPFIFHNVAKERWQDQGPSILRLKPGAYSAMPGGKREHVVEVMGRKKNDIQVPYLVDPNTGIKMFESSDIVKYLNKQYG